MQAIIGTKKKNANVCVDEDTADYVNKLNTFYGRFDNHDYSEEIANVKKSLSDSSSSFTVSEEEVKRTFDSLNGRKACGPDGVKGKTLKMCSSQLTYIYTLIFNMSIKNCIIPALWKCSEIIPIPKKAKVNEMNDLRPIALTSVVMKCLEKLVLNKVKSAFNNVQDPLQFAYRAKRSVEDAILFFLESAYKHIDIPRNYCRALFVDFSSAFNTIQPHILAKKMMEMKVDNGVVSWVLEFLTNRSQYVKLNNVKSKKIHTNTGAPQGCVISPVLFTIYTNDCQINNIGVKLIKFADDSLLLGLISDNEEEYYKDAINGFVKWCEEHHLDLNVLKTKELIIDFRQKKEPLNPIFINGRPIEVVDSYNYLGVLIHKDLDWEPHAQATYKKMNQRLYFLRKLNTFNINCKILHLFSRSTIESVLMFCIIGWGGNCNVSLKKRFDRLLEKSAKITKQELTTTDFLLNLALLNKIKRIIEDKTHPLNNTITHSERSGRVHTIKANRERYRNSFLPSAVKLYYDSTQGRKHSN